MNSMGIAEVIEIDKSSETPLYLQLAEGIRRQVESGALHKGERLPSEIRMAETAGVSVGTVKKAYSWLQDRAIVKKVRGGGAYVQESKTAAAADKAVPEDVVREMFEKAADSKLPMNRLFLLAREELRKYFQEQQQICAALVECNLEILHVIIPELESIPNLRVEPYLLEDLLSGRRIVSSRCDLAFTSRVHYHDFVRYADALRIPTESFALVENRETIAALATLPEDKPVCILYRSRSFLEKVQNTLGFLKKTNEQICVSEDNIDSSVDWYCRQGVPLVISPDYLEYSSAKALQVISRAQKSRSRVIPVRYEIDQGSWMHLIEVVREYSKQKRGGGS